MMDPRPMGIVVVMIGAVATAISALADPLGIGEGHVFGWLQITGVIVGAVVILLGFVMAMEWMPFFGGAAGKRAGASTATSPQTTVITDRSRQERPTT